MDNDLISRSALERELLDKGFYPAIVRAAVNKAPAVDAEPVVHGYWVYEPWEPGDPGEPEDFYCCSECDHYIRWPAGVTFDYRRCPICGAILGEEAEQPDAEK